MKMWHYVANNSTINKISKVDQKIFKISCFKKIVNKRLRPFKIKWHVGEQ